MIIWFLPFVLLVWCIILTALWILNQPRSPRKKHHLIIVYAPLMHCWTLFANICWGVLNLCSSGILAFNFLFLWSPCMVLISGWLWPCKMRLKEFPPLLLFWKSLRMIGINSSWIELSSSVSLVKPSDPGLLVVWRVFNLLNSNQFIQIFNFFMIQS